MGKEKATVDRPIVSRFVEVSLRLQERLRALYYPGCDVIFRAIREEFSLAR